jgi:hypothetical protein
VDVALGYLIIGVCLFLYVLSQSDASRAKPSRFGPIFVSRYVVRTCGDPPRATSRKSLQGIELKSYYF